MRVRLKEKPEFTGGSDAFNTHSVFPIEVIVGWDSDPDGTPNGMDSVYARDLEVETVLGQWTCMSRAFKRKLLIPDNYNRIFRCPKTDKERERGWFD